MAPKRSACVIIADNNEFYRRLLGDFYAERGYEARVARDGIEALEMIEQRRPDLLVLDLIMPRFDGARLCSYLKGQEGYRSLPVIILSGILADEIEDVEEIRADAYVAKMPMEQMGGILGEISDQLVSGRRQGHPILSGFEKMYRREVVLELLQERKSSHDILNSLSEGIVELSADRRILMLNSALREMTGRPEAWLLSRPVEEVFPQARETLAAMFADLKRGASPAEARIHHPPRELHIKLHRFQPSWVEESPDSGAGPASRAGIRGAVLRAAKEASKVQLESMLGAERFTMLVEDVTAQARADRDRDQLRERLAHSEKMSAIGMFVAGAAHELNNPLTSVLGYSQLLYQAHKDGPLGRELEKIATGAERCRKIVESLMVFARSHRPDKTPVDFNVLLQEALASCAGRLRAAGAEVVLRLEAGLPPAQGDPAQVLQAFVAVLDNACKALAAHEGRRVLTLSSRREEGWIRLCISDSGPGIPPIIMQKIFDPFVTTRQVGQGQGLGLSVAYGVVTAHAGRIGARVPPEGGTAIDIDFPILPPGAARPAEPAAAEAREGAAARERRILIVDDEAVVQELLSDIIHGAGRCIETASNGIDGLRKLNESTFDLVILDLRMPDMSGQQLYEEVRRSRPEMRDKMIFITADRVSPEVDQFLRRTGNRCLTKPFSIDSVLESVEAVLGA